MKTSKLVIALLLLGNIVFAQTIPPMSPFKSNATSIQPVNKSLETVLFRGLTVGNSTSTLAGTIRWNGSGFEGYNGSAWAAIGGSTVDALTTSTVFAGDVTGTSSSMLLSKIQGRTVTTTQNPSVGYILKWKGTYWDYTPDDTGAGGGITTLNGQTGSTQTITTSTYTGSVFYINSAADTTYLNIPSNPLFTGVSTTFLTLGSGTGILESVGGKVGVTTSVFALQSALSGYEPTITAGTTGQYWRGDKTWQNTSTLFGYTPISQTQLALYVDGYLASTTPYVSNTYASTTFATKLFVTDGYVASTTLASYIPYSYASSVFATKDFLTQGYVASTTLNSYATKLFVTDGYVASTTLDSYATKLFVTQGYVASTTLDSYMPYSYATSVYATKNFVTTGYLASTTPYVSNSYASTTFSTKDFVTQGYWASTTQNLSVTNVTTSKLWITGCTNNQVVISDSTGYMKCYATSALGITGGSGTTDHAALSNLDYANAGHTGFEPTVTKGNLSASGEITVTNGTGAVIGTGTSIKVNTSTITNGEITKLVTPDAVYDFVNEGYAPTTTAVTSTYTGALSLKTVSSTGITTQFLWVTGSSVLGNASSTNLTAGDIWGTNLLGFTNISATNASTTNLTNSGNAYLGTVKSGVWNGTVIGDAYITKTGAWTGTIDGNNFSGAIAQGEIMYGTAAGEIGMLAKSSDATRYLSNTGGDNNPAWAQINLANGVTGNLPILNGGTATTTWVKDTIVFVGNGQLTSDPDFKYTSTTNVLTFVNGSSTVFTAPTLYFTNASGTSLTASGDIWAGNLYGVSKAIITNASTTNITATDLWATNIYGVSQLNFTNASGTNATFSGNSYLGTVKSGTWNGTVIGLTYGGTGTTTAPSTDQILWGNAGNTYDLRRLVAGSNITISTSTAGQVVIASTATGGGGANYDLIWATTATNGLLIIPTSSMSMLTADFAIGSNATATAPFWWDVSATTSYIGIAGAGDGAIDFTHNGTQAISLGYDYSAGYFAFATNTDFANPIMTMNTSSKAIGFGGFTGSITLCNFGTSTAVTTTISFASSTVPCYSNEGIVRLARATTTLEISDPPLFGKFDLTIVQGTSTTSTVTWDSEIAWEGGFIPSLPSGTSSVSILSCQYKGAMIDISNKKYICQLGKDFK